MIVLVNGTRIAVSIGTDADSVADGEALLLEVVLDTKM
jgi:hypothetical protein